RRVSWSGCEMRAAPRGARVVHCSYIQGDIAMIRKLLLVAAAGAAFSVCAGQARAAMFSQCPPVGASAGCALLVTINTNAALTFNTDSSIVAYDGDDDTLVGVVNSSGVTQQKISLSGKEPFGFDGDGAGTFVSGGPFGTTGYEGPNTSFTVNSDHHGDVNFT